MLAPVSYKVVIPMHVILTENFTSLWSHIWICIILARSCWEEASSCKACKLAWSHSFHCSSEEVSWKRFQNSILNQSNFITVSHYGYLYVILNINDSHSWSRFLYWSCCLCRVTIGTLGCEPYCLLTNGWGLGHHYLGLSSRLCSRTLF